jgi:hypothetical protein
MRLGTEESTNKNRKVPGTASLRTTPIPNTSSRRPKARTIQSTDANVMYHSIIHDIFILSLRLSRRLDLLVVPVWLVQNPKVESSWADQFGSPVTE